MWKNNIFVLVILYLQYEMFNYIFFGLHYMRCFLLFTWILIHLFMTVQ